MIVLNYEDPYNRLAYQTATSDEVDEALHRVVYGHDLLDVPGVYELVKEHFNNETLDRLSETRSCKPLDIASGLSVEDLERLMDSWEDMLECLDQGEELPTDPVPRNTEAGEVVLHADGFVEFEDNSRFDLATFAKKYDLPIHSSWTFPPGRG